MQRRSPCTAVRASCVVLGLMKSKPHAILDLTGIALMAVNVKARGISVVLVSHPCRTSGSVYVTRIGSQTDVSGAELLVF